MATPASALVQHWIVPASPRAPQIAHIFATARSQESPTPLCGEDRRAWLPVSEADAPHSVGRCRRCLIRWRGLQPTTLAGQVIPHRFRDQHQTYLDVLARRRFSDHTRRSYAANAAAFLRWAAEHDLAPGTWGLAVTSARYQRDLTDDDLGPAAVNARLLAQADLARALEVRRREPTLRVPRPPVVGQILSPAELNRIRRRAVQVGGNAHVLVEVLSKTGLKPSEIADLTTASVARIDDTQVALTVHGRTVMLDLSVSVLDVTQPRPLLATGQDNRVMSQRRIRQILTELGRDLGMADLAASNFRTTWIADRLCAGALGWQIGQQLGVKQLRTQPIQAGLHAQQAAEREAITTLAPRLRSLSKTAGTAMIDQARRAQQGWLSIHEDLDDQVFELNLRVLRQIRHIDLLDLSSFIDEHSARLQAIYATYPVDAPVWLIRQPAALAVWAAMSAGMVIVGLPQLDDMTAAWHNYG